MKKITITILFLTKFLITGSVVQSADIVNLAYVDNYLITNIDLRNEIKVYEIYNNTKVPQDEYNAFLNSIIEYTIKEIEIKKFEINISDEDFIERINLFEKKLKLENSSINDQSELIYLFKKKIKIDLGWKKVILKQFRRNIEINIDEINKISLEKKLTDKEKEKLTLLEKNKALNKLSQSYFNNIRKEHLIKILK